MYNIMTMDALVSPATAQELVDWARLDSDDPKIESSLLVATRLVISFLKLDLLPRTYTLTYEDWPIVGTVSGGILSQQNYALKSRIELPYANTISITSVTVNGVALASTEYRIIKGKPDRIQFDQFGYSTSDNTALEVVYTAGYGATFADVPVPIIQAVVMVAGYVHTHAGGCDMASAVKSSGASELLTPYAAMAGLSL